MELLLLISNMASACPLLPVHHKAVFSHVSHLADQPNRITICSKHQKPKLNVLQLTDSCNFDKNGVPALLVCNVGGTAIFLSYENDTIDKLDWPTLVLLVMPQTTLFCAKMH